tara:strand:- start:326 stop:586 length:261 start_codon:yes stop_codon:yes gene_type:complete
MQKILIYIVLMAKSAMFGWIFIQAMIAVQVFVLTSLYWFYLWLLVFAGEADKDDHFWLCILSACLGTIVFLLRTLNKSIKEFEKKN